MVDLIIGGDAYPNGINLTYFKEGNAKKIINELFNEFFKADLSWDQLRVPNHQ